MSTTYKRNGNRWTINEILTLQREYELLEWSVYKIAEKHQRTVMAILCKLKAEGFIQHFKTARGFDIEEYKKHLTDLDLKIKNIVRYKEAGIYNYYILIAQKKG